MKQSFRRVLAATAATALASVTMGVSSASAEPEPVTGPKKLNFSAALLYGLGQPDAQAQGVNDWSCVPEEGKNPVVLVHGTFANQYDSFARMAPELKAAGHCLYSFNYGKGSDAAVGKIPGRYGLNGLSENGDELAAFADTVRERTGYDELDMVGWSQGGTLITDVLKKEGGDGIDDVVTYGASHHGASIQGLALVAKYVAGEDITRDALGQAAVDQIPDSEYLQQLTADGDTVPGVDYTIVGTKYDQISTPYRNTFFEQGPGATVTNITLQDGCSIDLSSHVSMMYSPRAIDIAKRALDPNKEGRLRCLPNAPVV